jgi:hypothetical protein
LKSDKLYSRCFEFVDTISRKYTSLLHGDGF